MSESLKISAGSNLNQWANALGSTHPDVAKVLGENRRSGFEALDELGLPHYERVILPLEDFIQDPLPALQELQSEKFYVVAQPKQDSAGRVSKSGLDADKVFDFLTQHIAPDQRNDYELIVQQYFKNLYGGSIIVNPSGRIYAEFKEGKQGPISKGTATPDYFVTRDQYNGIFRYSFDDIELRTAIFSTIRCIPHYGSGRYTNYHPGYYEFALVDKNEDSTMAPIFFDYRQGKLFEIPD
jgi:hypothetical protein